LFLRFVKLIKVVMLKNILKGALIGAADPIPGVSGGTVAFITGIYDELLDRITRFHKHPDGMKKNLIFLIPVGVGLLSGMFVFAHIAEWLIQQQPELTMFAFIGLVLGSITPILIKERPSVHGWPVWIALSISCAIAVLFNLIPKPELNAPIIDPTPLEMLWLATGGAMAAATMVVPGISGSFLQLILGTYSTYISAIKDLNLSVLLPFGAGAVIGIVLMANIISKLFRHYYHATLLAIAGLVIGSVVALWPGWGLSFTYIMGLWSCFVGIAIGWVLATFREDSRLKANLIYWVVAIMALLLLIVIAFNQFG